MARNEEADLPWRQSMVLHPQLNREEGDDLARGASGVVPDIPRDLVFQSSSSGVSLTAHVTLLGAPVYQAPKGHPWAPKEPIESESLQTFQKHEFRPILVQSETTKRERLRTLFTPRR